MKKLICVFIAVGTLLGCNNKDEVRLTTELNQTISIYSGSKSNFDRAYMLANAFSSNDAVSILAIGTDEEEFTYTSKSGAEIKVVPNLHSDFSQLSQLIVENSSDDKKFNLFISSMDVERNSLLSDEAFSIVDEIYVVIEGTASLGSSGELLDSAKTFYQQAIKNGVKSVEYVVWDSIKEDLLMKEGGIGLLAEAGIGFHFVSFNEMKEKIDILGVDGGLISAAIYTGAISKSIVGKQIFEKSITYSEDKDTVVLFGSYTRDEPKVSYVNQINILDKIESISNLDKYNVVFKGHPREVAVNDWIADNSKSISYFLSFPYEIWQVLGQGTYVYQFDNIEYSMYLPREPSQIYSVFSSTLYGEDVSKIRAILGYNKLDELDNITNHMHDVGVGDVDEYERWSRLTENSNVPFIFTYDFIQN
ncbi:MULTISPECIES: hypothetical protein [Shewanella]|uniref:hypothetical protein n=1 Tax=Shewanella TaxID=22 RepID=UPI001CF21244|nr:MULTISPECIES: hypothetical protein [Shewanella]MCB2381950.1 hypothetical protein [Shewanella sp. SR1]MCS6175155.1 hypothetical protein [Shewanella baltica]